MDNNATIDSILNDIADQQPPTQSVPINSRDHNPAVDQILDGMVEQERATAQLRTSLQYGVGENPDQAAEVNRLARERNVTPDIIRSDLPGVQREQAVQDINPARLTSDSPITARFLANPDNAAMAHDNVANMSALEQALQYGKNTGSAVLSGVYGMSEGVLGVAQAGAELVDRLTNPLSQAIGVDLGSMTPAIAHARAGQTYLKNYWSPKGSNDIESGIYSGISSLTQNLLLAPAAIMSGNPTMMVAPMAGITGGQSFAEARDKGISLEHSLLNATSNAMVEAATESIPMGKLVGDLANKAGFWQMLGHQAVSEIPNEQIATIFQDMNDWAIQHPEKSFQQYLDERPSAAAQTLVATMVGVGGNVSVLKGVEKIADRNNRRAASAVKAAEYTAQVDGLIKADKVLQRDPTSFENFIKEATEDGPVDHLYLGAEVLNQSGLAPKLAEVAPELAEKIQVALATGGQVQIPVGLYAAKIAPTEVSTALLSDLKTDPDGFSMREAQEYMAAHNDELKSMVERSVTEANGNAEFKASQEVVRQQVLNDLNAANRFTPAVNELYATLHSAYAAVRAAQIGITPEQFFRQHMLRVQAERVGGQQYDQSVPFAPDILSEWGDFKTGQSVTFDYIHNTESATKLFGKPKKGDRFQRDIEPSGRYVNQGDVSKLNDPRFIGGQLTFQNPLVLHADNWKQALHDHYRKRGKYLSQALLNDGYDGVVTVGKYGPSEILDLTTFDSGKALYQSNRKIAEAADKAYLEAVANGDMETAQRMVDAAAVKAGYITANDYRMSHRAPNREDDVSLADVRSSGLVPDDYWTHPQWYQSDPRERVAFNSVMAAMQGKSQRLWIYRAVPKSVKDDKVRNGDWVTPNRDYAMDEGKMIPEGYRIIAQRVSLNDVFWDGNSIAELGFDDGKEYGYQNTKNNRKLMDAVTRDEEGNVIPLSKRFNKRDARVFYQSATLRSGSETLKKYGLDPEGKYKTRDIAAALEARQREKYGTIAPDDRSDEALKKISKWMVEEVLFEMQNPEKSGVGWYSEKFQAALDIMSDAFPELKTDVMARNTMTALIAITSDGQKVMPNFAQAMDIYGNYQETGQFTTSRGHARLASIDTNLKRLQELADMMSPEELHAYLMREETISELKQIAKDNGGEMKSDYQAHVKMPMAAVEFGPKLGAFYANLMGAHGYLTMDRWWSRTFNRYRGTLLTAPTQQGLERFRELIGKPDLSDDETIAATVEPRNAYAKKRFKGGSEIEKAANTIYKAAFDELEDAPFNATDRTFMLDAVNKAQKSLKRRGYNLSVADIQAILWYYEKRLYGDLGARKTADVSYEEAAKRVVSKWADSRSVDVRGESGSAGQDSAGDQEQIPPGEEYFQSGEVGSAGDLLVQHSFFQQREANRGAFNPETNTITLLKNADLSTFLHESAHFFFENDIAIASDYQEQANIMGIDSLSSGERQILDDMHTLLSWHGIQGDLNDQLNQWHNMGFEERRSYHERTAESFEKYMLEGKAPSLELAHAFQSFRAWMMQVYKSIKNFLQRNPEAGQLSDEVRQVFDRMLATQEEIQLAEMARSMIPLFSQPGQAGISPEQLAEFHKLGIDATNTAIDELQARALKDLGWFDKARSRELKKLQSQARGRRRELLTEARTEIMSQPVYIVWDFLTRKMTDADRIGGRPAAGGGDRRDIVNPSRDSLFTAIGKLGGIDKADLVSDGWIDDSKGADKPHSGVIGKPVWRVDGTGRSIDDIAQSLAEDGYVRMDVHGKADMIDFAEKFGDELRGSKVYSNTFDYRNLDEQIAGGHVVNPAALGAGKLDIDSLINMDFSDAQVALLTERRMTQKTGALHPDIVNSVVGGFSSGDEMVRALLDAVPPKQAIDQRVDQMMIERYGDLSDQASIEMAADKAIHNDLRAKMIAAEMAALETAARVTAPGQARGPSILPKAAKEFAQGMIARLRVRDIRPGMYANAEMRAAKAAATAEAKGDVATAASEKRNQLIQHYATRVAYDTQDEVERGVRYLRNLDKDAARKRISADYMDQIDQLLERVQLRPLSLKEVDRRKSLAAWLESQKEQGLEPDIDPQLVQQSLMKSYRDMTVEEFRGLMDAVKQIEHLGALKNKLLTAKDQREYEAVRDEMVSSINEHAGDRVANTRTATTTMGRKIQGLKNFWASHIKAATWARIMDGGEVGGPVWEYLIRPANERGDWETLMTAEATNALAVILKPVLALGKMSGNAQYFSSIGRSLTRQEKLAIALNVGNEGNKQRLLGGEGWTMDQILPVLQSLSPVELNAVQQIWDHLESYRPLIAEKERRVYGKEPDWVEPTPFSITASDKTMVFMRGGYYPIKYDPLSSQRAEEHADAEGARRELQGAYTSATTRRSFTKSRTEAVIGRPLLYDLSGLYSGVTDVIHDLAWHEWLIDANRLLRSDTLDKAIREHYGPEAKNQFKTWAKDIADGGRGTAHAIDTFSAWVRHSVSASGLGFNLMSAAIQPLGFTQSIVQVGARYVGRGIARYIANPKGMTREVNEMSTFMANRARTRFRELNELRNQVQDQTRHQELIGRYAYWLMMRAQQIVDVPTWWGAYEKAIAEGNDDPRAIAMADQAVIDAQGGGQLKDLAAVERGGPTQKLFTVFYTFMNTALNLGVGKTMTSKSRGKLAADLLMLYVVPAVLGSLLKDALTPGDAGDDEPEELAASLAKAQLSYLAGLMVGVRELGGLGYDYGGPAGLRMFGDFYKLFTQSAQMEFDDGFRKAAINLIGDFSGLPAAQINRTITGTEALIEGKTDNPAAVVMGYQKPH